MNTEWLHIREWMDWASTTHLSVTSVAVGLIAFFVARSLTRWILVGLIAGTIRSVFGGLANTLGKATAGTASA